MKTAVFLILAMLTALAACKMEDKTPPSGLQGYDPHLVDHQRAACEKRGGTFARAGKAGGFVCFEMTRDAGKRCSVASQCESACLARSQSCAPIKPLLGCNEVLTISGTATNLCVD